MAVALVVLGAVVIVAGVALIWIPGAVIVAGLELVVAGYVKAYMEASE